MEHKIPEEDSKLKQLKQGAADLLYIQHTESLEEQYRDWQDFLREARQDLSLSRDEIAEIEHQCAFMLSQVGEAQDKELGFYEELEEIIRKDSNK